MHFSLPTFFLPLQGTVQRAGGCKGIGVHTGKQVSLKIFPAPAHSGIIFVRMDQEKAIIPATWRQVVDTRFSTTLGNDDGVTLSTVEHLLAALWAVGVDNARIEVDGPEIPILDGSSAPWIALLEDLGITHHKALAPVVEILKTIRIQENDSWIEIKPSDTFSLAVTVPLGTGPDQKFSYTLGDFFAAHVASARTFSLLEHVQKMRAMGLIRGGSLENAVVLDGDKVLNPEGLRFPNECARHKALDLIGDWSLAARLILGRVEAYAPGHGLNHKMLRHIFEDKTAWRFLSYAPHNQKATALEAHAV